ncbi:N-6 DNA methylase [Clostridium butyricum]|uniref:N-6 DNA methylase n=1 Tax=Clostridium butyricum TaxID=1492 RepID=UPI0034652C52
MDKNRRNYFKQLLLDNHRQFNYEMSNLLEMELQKSILHSREVIEESFSLLENISLEEVSTMDLLSIIDEVFISESKIKQYRIPNWLAEFMVKVSDVKENAKILDLNNRFGEITTSATILSNNIPVGGVYGINLGMEGAIISKIQQLMLGNRAENIIIENDIDEHLIERHNIPMPTNIITALPFGVRRDTRYFYKSYNFGCNKFEDYLLRLAINWTQNNGVIVALVNESFLFEDGNRRKFRNQLLEEVSLRAIISLPSGALLPSSSVKTSIIVLNKVIPKNDNLIFMADIKNDVSNISHILNEYSKYMTNNNEPIKSENFSIVTRCELNRRNLTVKNYLPIYNKSYGLMKYPMYKLEDITSDLKRGRASKVIDDGQINLLGPAAIRPLEIVKSNIGNTTVEQLGTRPIQVRYKDVVINNIGTYLGAAAMVEEEIIDTVISQHVVLVRANISLILPEYLAIALNSDFVKEQIYRTSNGSVMPSISLQNLKEVEIPVPDIEEQKHIVNKIYESRNKIVQIKKLLNENIAIFEKMLSSMHLEEDR